MFIIKKLISAFFLPVPQVTIFIILGLVLLVKYKRIKTGIGFIAGAVVFLNILSYEPISSSLLLPIEKKHPGFEFKDTTLSYIVVLGGGVSPDTTLPLSSLLGTSSLFRIVEGITIANKFPNATLIVSGYGGMSPITSAETYRKVALSLGIDSGRIITLPETRDTHQEAVEISTIVKDTPFALVTSASHMPRAYKLFRKQGTQPIPAPTSFISVGKGILQPPSGGGLSKAETAIHEYLGLLWASIRGQI